MPEPREARNPRDPTKILIYGVGNPGRQDDGAGPDLVRRVQERFDPGSPARSELVLRFDADYQLMVENAADLAEHDIVVFVDATTERLPGPRLSRVRRADTVAFSTHSVSAESVAGLAYTLYGATPRVYMLHVPGYAWGFTEGLTPEARGNVEEACRLLVRCLQEPSRFDRRCETR